MKDVTDIVAEYRNSDFEQRLSLFLCHRAMRDQFTRIDLEETQTRKVGKKTTSWLIQPVTNPFRRLVNWCCGPAL